MHVGPLAGRYPSQLSAGQQQRVAIARALAPEPEILLFDEPFSALDVQLKERLELEFLALQEHYKGEMLLVTHDLAEGYKLGNKIAVFQAGSIIQCGSKHNVFFAPANRTVARLTGIRNLMKGTVTRLDSETAEVFIPAWQQTLSIRPPAAQPLTIGQPVSVGIRPEHIRMEPGGQPNSLVCRILQAAEGISSYAYRFQVSSDTESQHLLNASVRKGGRSCLQVEECCEVYLPPEYLVLITG
jgi:molybdate transport system ATP-binding protein